MLANVDRYSRTQKVMDVVLYNTCAEVKSWVLAGRTDQVLWRHLWAAAVRGVFGGGEESTFNAVVAKGHNPLGASIRHRQTSG